MHTKLSISFHLANLTITLSSWLLLTSKNSNRKYQWCTQYGNGPMKWMLSYRTVSLAQTGICSGILLMALSRLPHISPASLSASMTLSPQCRTPISQPEAMDYKLHPHWAKGRTAITRTLIRNPVMPSNELSDRQSVTTGPRSTTLALTLVGCARVCKLSQITKGNPAASCPGMRAHQKI